MIFRKNDRIKDLSVETALEIANEIEDASNRGLAIENIAGYLAKAGEHDRALSLADTSYVIEELSYDDKERAKKLFEKDPFKYIFQIVDSGLSREEKLELIKKAFERAKNADDYHSVARAFAKLGARDEALEALNIALNLETDRAIQVDVLKGVACDLYKSGFVEDSLEVFKQAFDIALRLDSSYKDDFINFKLRWLAKSLADVGEFDLALSVTERIKDNEDRGYALQRIIEKIYEINEEKKYADKAFELAEDLGVTFIFICRDIWDWPYVKSSTFICRDIWKLKNVKGVNDLLNKLERFVKLSHALAKLAEGLNILGSHALAELAKVYAVLGDYDYALNLAEMCTTYINDRLEAVGYIAYRFAKDGYRSKAENLLKNLDNNYTETGFYKALCHIRFGEINRAKKIIISLHSTHKRVLLELIDIGRYKDAIKIVKNLAKKLDGGFIQPILASEFDEPYIDPDYKSKSLIFRIVSSDLRESEKIQLLNEVYLIAKRYIKDEDIHKYQSKTLKELAEAIAWYSLRDKIVERARRLEERGYIKKAIELYRFAEETKEFKRLREKLVEINVEAPRELSVNKKHELKISIKPVTTVYDLNIKFENQNVKIIKDGKEISSFSIPSITDYLVESFEIIPLKPNITDINITFNYKYFDYKWGKESEMYGEWELTSKTETRTLSLKVKEVKKEETYQVKTVTPFDYTMVKKERMDVIIPSFPSQLLSKYEVIELLGEGGFAKVFKCRRKKDGIIVAVKIPEESEEAGKSFIEEIANWKKLKHINIVHLYDYNSIPYPHIEMELCDFTLKEITNLTLKDRLRIACRIADALSYAHSKGIVHGDLKPSNVLIKRVGDQMIPKLTDWGMGYTPAYSPPEVVIEKFEPDVQADVWSFGVILYELVTGVNPFQGEDLGETMDKIAELNPDLTPLGILKPIVSKCLEKDRGKRYKSMIEVRRDLANLNASTLNNLSSRSKNRREMTQIATEIVATYIASNEFKKAEKRIDSFLKYKRITPQAHEVYRTIIEILTADELTLSFLDSKFRHILEILPEYKKEFEEDEYIGRLLKKIIAHRKGVCEIIRKGEEEFDMIRNIFCMRVLDVLGKIACETL